VLVERGLEQDDNAALRALVNDYVQHATLQDQVPMLARRQLSATSSTYHHQRADRSA
jgi:hypothetical protein